MKINSIDDIREYVEEKGLDNDLAYSWEDILWSMDELGIDYSLSDFRSVADLFAREGDISIAEYQELFGSD